MLQLYRNYFLINGSPVKLKKSKCLHINKFKFRFIFEASKKTT